MDAVVIKLIGLAREHSLEALASTFVVLWWLERKERKELQTAVATMTTRMITVMVQTTKALRRVGKVFGGIEDGDEDA